MTVYMWCVCYECRMFYHCIIMDLEPVKKHLFILPYMYKFISQFPQPSNIYNYVSELCCIW